MNATPRKFHLTITANYSDGTEIADIEPTRAIPLDRIGQIAWEAAEHHYSGLGDAATAISSLVIVMVPEEEPFERQEFRQ